jgi:thiamine-monophosphate kinase
VATWVLHILGYCFWKGEKNFLESPGVQPDLEGESYVIGRLLKPEARKDIIEFLLSRN